MEFYKETFYAQYQSIYTKKSSHKMAIVTQDDF